MEQLKTAEGDVYLEISYEKENNWIRCVWYGNVPIKYVSKGSDRYLTILKETKCPKLLNDNQSFESNWVAINEYFENEGLEKAYSYGLRYMAHVHSSRFITRFSAVDLGTRIKNFEFKLFDQLNDAEDWLHSC